jgi:hypothetical protein
MTTDGKWDGIGKLLLKADLVKGDVLKAIVGLVVKTPVSVEPILVLSKGVSKASLRAAAVAQSMIADSCLDEESAIAALKLSDHESIPFEQALNRLNLGQPSSEALREAGVTAQRPANSTARLGELLVEAQLISNEDLEDVTRTRDETGLPLGRIVVLTKLLSEELLAAALTAQVLLRDGKVTKEQVIEGLKLARKKRVSLETALADQGVFRPPVRQAIKLGDLLVLAELIMENDLMTALELSLVRQVPVGRILLQSGLITPPVLEAALELQEMVRNGALNSLQAAYALRQIATQRFSLPQALAELGTKDGEGTVRLGDILKAAGIVSENDIRRAIELSAKSSALVGKMLVAAGMLDESMLYAALRCQFLIRDGSLSLDQAISALKRCQESGKSLDEVGREMGFIISTAMEI